MARVYAVTFENVTVSAAQDLFSLQPADDKPVEIVSIHLSNVGGTGDAGDAQEELLRLLVRRGHTSVGSGGSSVTAAAPIDSSAGATWGFTARVNDTTIASAGTTQDLFADGWNIRVPYQQVFLPDARPGASQANTLLVVRLVAAPADAVSVSGTLILREV